MWSSPASDDTRSCQWSSLVLAQPSESPGDSVAAAQRVTQVGLLGLTNCLLGFILRWTRSISRKESVMSEAPAVTEAPKEGTAAHFMHFLDWAESRGEISKATVSNWRGASKNILEIEQGWEQINLMELDLDSFISRFET